MGAGGLGLCWLVDAEDTEVLILALLDVVGARVNARIYECCFILPKTSCECSDAILVAAQVYIGSHSDCFRGRYVEDALLCIR